MGSIFHRIQRIKLFTRTKFHACIIKCTIHVDFDVKRLHYKAIALQDVAPRNVMSGRGFAIVFSPPLPPLNHHC